ncbi:MAG: cytochrome c biogenesis CcdA family protein [Coriobacteriia bacterium]
MVASIVTQLSSGELAGVVGFAAAFLGGVLGAFSPCVLPLLPAVVGFVTGQTGLAAEEERPRSAIWRRSAALSALFVLGTSITFAIIGTLAGALGHALRFGAVGYYLAAAVCALLGLHMLGVIDLKFDALNRLMPVKRPGRRGFLGALLFGMLFGLVSSPCATPILGAIATLAMVSGSAAQGAALLFLYGLGYGVPVFALGMASGSLGALRRLSQATGVLTKIGGAVLLVAAVYLAWIA